MPVCFDSHQSIRVPLLLAVWRRWNDRTRSWSNLTFT